MALWSPRNQHGLYLSGLYNRLVIVAALLCNRAWRLFEVYFFSLSLCLGTTSTPNDLWYNIIELPYHGESVSMLIALPTESTTPLSAIIPHISTKTIQSWMTTMVQKRVQVILPK